MSLVDGIQDALRTAIVAGKLGPGFRLREVLLAKHFSCSTTPVREAVRNLEAEGLVTVHARRGAEVATISEERIAELYETRLVLECFAVRQAAERRPDAAALAPVKATLVQQRAMLADPNTMAMYPTDIDFHRALCSLSGNSVIADLVARVALQITVVRSLAEAVVDKGPRRSVNAHQAIVAAIEKGDADKAEDLMRRHLEWASNALATSLRKARS
jgi:DNA-binding GntR family transcriptional regulator